MHATTGNFSLGRLERLTAVFLPPAQSNTIYPYNPTDGGNLWCILSSADGTELARFDLWALERPAPFWMVDDAWVTDLATGERVHTGDVALPPGNYTIDYFLDTGRFYTFSFAVSKLDSDDPFRPETHWFLDGPWEDWGYLTYPTDNPGRGLAWKAFLRNKTRERNRSVRVEVTITRDADASVVCTSRTATSWTLRPEWRRFTFDLVHPGGEVFRASDLLAHDGSYTLRMSVDGAPHGTWGFTVAAGRLQHTGRTVRGAVDPLQFIEGGTDQWWYIRRESGEASAVAAATTGPVTTVVDPHTAVPPTDGQSLLTTEIIAGAAPITVNGHTMVPLRSVFQWLGAEVKWIPQALTIIANRGDQDIVMMRLDEDEATVNGRKVPLPQRPVQRDGITYVPLRFSAEAFGATVGFDAATGSITITDGDRVGVLAR